MLRRIININVIGLVLLVFWLGCAIGQKGVNWKNQTEQSMTIIALPSYVNVRQDDTLELVCKAFATGQPQIRFIANGVEIVQYSSSVQFPRARIAAVAKVKVLVRQSGVVICEASSGNKTAQGHFNITVSDENTHDTDYDFRFMLGTTIEKPEITYFDYAYADEIGSNAVLPCKIGTYGSRYVTWYNPNGSRIKSDWRKYSITPSGELTIFDIHPIHRGIYTCVCRNEHGQDQIETYLGLTHIENGNTTLGEDGSTENDEQWRYHIC